MPDLRQIAVAAAVAILSAVFIALLIDAVYPEPKWSDYCEDEFGPRFKAVPAVPPGIETRCDYYGDEEQQCYRDGGLVRTKLNESGCPVFDKCDFCNKDYDAARKVYTRNVFIIAGIIGVIAIFSGTMWKIEFLASGLMFGGIILLFYATMRYFHDADKLLRVIIVFVELLLVLWIGYKKLYKKGKKKNKKKR